MKRALFTLSLYLISVHLQARQESDSCKKTSYTLAALYNSNINYYGQVTTKKLPYVLMNATVRMPFSLYFSASSYKFINYGSGISGTDLSVGYDYDFNNKLTVGLAYTHSFYPANSPLLQASLTNNINGSISYLWPIFKSTLDVDYAFGNDHDIFFSLSNSKDISLGSLFDEKDLISIEPSLELVAGTRNYFETYIRAKNQRGQEMGNGKPPSNPGNSGGTVEYIPSRSFSMLTYNAKLPLNYSRGSYLLELSYQLSLLAPSDDEIKETQSFFGIAFYYQF